MVISQHSGDRSSDSALAGVSILLVDDDTDNRDLLTFVLQDSQAQVTAVASAHEALDVLSQQQPDVLISDIGLPDMDGYTLIGQVNQLQEQENIARAPEGKTLKTIALTAFASEEDQQRAIAAGFQHYLAKPIDPLEVVATIARLVS